MTSWLATGLRPLPPTTRSLVSELGRERRRSDSETGDDRFMANESPRCFVADAIVRRDPRAREGAASPQLGLSRARWVCNGR